MSFEEYNVFLCPKELSSIRRNQNLEDLAGISSALLAQFPEIKLDTYPLDHLEYPSRQEELFHVYQSQAGIIEIVLNLNKREGCCINISLRFAYCNPRIIYEPYCSIIEWLMARYSMYCEVMRDLAPSQECGADTIDKSDNVRAALIPSMDYNRKLWQLDAGSEEEAILRPGQAIERYMEPLYIAAGNTSHV